MRSVATKLIVLFICIAFVIADIIIASVPQYRIWLIITIPATLILLVWIVRFWIFGVFDIDDDDSL